MKPCIDRRLLALLPVLLLGACSAGPVPRASVVRATPAPVATAPIKLADENSVGGKPNADVRFRNALQMMAEHKTAEAQQAFQNLSKDYPDMSGPLTDLGILYGRSKQRSQAIASFARAIVANPRNAVALNWCGALYREAGDFPQAEKYYLKALAARPDYAAAAFNLGILYEVSMHRSQDALAQYRRYQNLSGQGDLIVTAWIMELETSAKLTVASNENRP